MGFLNRYFEEMVGLVFEHEGTLITFIGDAILAVYGLPAPRPDDAERALHTALHMRRRLAELNADGVFEWVGGLRIGMAVHTGEVLAGSIGSPQRLEYTVIGDTVNTAARLEESNKKLETDLVVSETTVAAIVDRSGLVDRGELQLRGRAQPLRIFTVEREQAGVKSG